MNLRALHSRRGFTLVELSSGGSVAFNILYCDGHVATATDRKEAYLSVRMKFPG
jgi:prepilin-type processing-associated H-X9-DG protein